MPGARDHLTISSLFGKQVVYARVQSDKLEPLGNLKTNNRVENLFSAAPGSTKFAMCIWQYSLLS